MSLEEQISKLTTAVGGLTEALYAAHPSEHPIAKAAEKTPAKELAGAGPQTVAAEKKAAKASSKKEPPVEGVDYSEVKAAALQLVKKVSRQALVDVLTKHDLETAAKAKPVQYPALLADLQKALRDAKTDPA